MYKRLCAGAAMAAASAALLCGSASSATFSLPDPATGALLQPSQRAGQPIFVRTASDGHRFITAGPQGSCGFGPGGWTTRLADGALLRVSFAGAGEAAPVGETPSSSAIRSIRMDDGTPRTKALLSYESIRYRNVWPGVDVVHKAAGRQLKYDIECAPGADVARIRLRVDGADGLRVDRDGALVALTSAGEVREEIPLVYQPSGEARIVRNARYVVQGNTVSFDVENVDSSLPLVIDPQTDLVWGTFLGGTSRDEGRAVAADATGIYVTGATFSADFPTTPEALDPDYNDDYDVFVAKLSPDGSNLLWSTFIGGADRDDGVSIAVDQARRACVTGWTKSPDFPTTAGAYDRTYNEDPEAGHRSDIFVLKLDAAGGNLVYSTFVGGADWDNATDVALDPQGNAYVTGYTLSADFPVTAGSFGAGPAVSSDVILFKINANGSALLYSGLLGGSDWESAESVALDSANRAYITGKTSSADFPESAQAYDSTYNGVTDAFVACISANGSTRVWSTFLGGSNQETGMSIFVGPGNTVHVAGDTISSNFPTTAGAFDPTYNGDVDAWMAALDGQGQNLLYSTFVGGKLEDYARSLVVDPDGLIYLTGGTASQEFPITPGAFDAQLSGILDGYVAVIWPDASRVIYSSYVGGGSSEFINSACLLPGGGIAAVGSTHSTDFPVTSGAYDTTQNGSSFTDAFCVVLSPTPSPFSAQPGQLVTLKGVVTDNAQAEAGRVVVQSLAAPWGMWCEVSEPVALQVGDQVLLSGTLAIEECDRVVQNTVFMQLGPTEVTPLTMKNVDVAGAASPDNLPGVAGASGLNNLGALVRTPGRVVSVDAGDGTFIISDRSPASYGPNQTGLKVEAEGMDLPGVGDFVTVTGISSCFTEGEEHYPLVRVRTQSDIELTELPAT